jgi:hypothetical protein
MFISVVWGTTFNSAGAIFKVKVRAVAWQNHTFVRLFK